MMQPESAYNVLSSLKQTKASVRNGAPGFATCRCAPLAIRMMMQSQARAGASSAPPAHVAQGRQRRGPPPARATSRAEDDASVLDAFFVGRALAEALNERLGRAVGTALADASKGSLTPQRLLDDLAAALTAPEAALAKVTRQEAELRAELRALQEDVLQRARDARSSVAVPPGSGEAWAARPGEAAAAEPAAGEEPPPKSLRATIEELRAEVETTRREVTGLQTPDQASDS